MIYLNAHELAARWRLSTKTLERWRNEGRGPAFVKLHRRVLYRLSEVEGFEAQRTQPTLSAAEPASP